MLKLIIPTANTVPVGRKVPRPKLRWKNQYTLLQDKKRHERTQSVKMNSRKYVPKGYRSTWPDFGTGRGAWNTFRLHSLKS